VKYLPFIISSVVIIASVLAGDWAIRVYVLKQTAPHHPPALANNFHPTPVPPFKPTARVDV
jgi:hypothetical protein